MKSLEGMRVLVTGGAGFIGSCIANDLVSHGAIVTVYDLPASLQRIRTQFEKNGIQMVSGDIRDRNQLLSACRDQDLVSHQAAVLETTLTAAKKVCDVNIQGSIEVFSAAAAAEVPRVIYASSETVYGQAVTLPQPESHPTNPLHPYGVSKLAVEKLVQVYSANHGTKTIGFRYSNVYGPGEWFGRVLTVFLKRAHQGKPPVLWGGDQVRDFIYVTDIAQFHSLCAAKEQLPWDIFNVSTGIGTTIRELGLMMSDMFGLDPPMVENVGMGQVSSESEGRMRGRVECKEMVLDNSRAKSLGWKPQVSLREGITKQYNWLKENPDAWNNLGIS